MPPHGKIRANFGVLRGVVCYYRAKFENGGQVQKMDFLHIYVIDGSSTKLNHRLNHQLNKADALYSILKEGMDVHLPTKRINIHNSDKPWITPYIKNLISER